MLRSYSSANFTLYFQISTGLRKKYFVSSKNKIWLYILYELVRIKIMIHVKCVSVTQKKKYVKTK